MRYDDDWPWPADADGLGVSLQLLDPEQDNDRAGNWGVVNLRANEQWTRVVLTGLSKSNTRQPIGDARVHFHLGAPGQVDIDDVWLCTGTVAEAAANLLENGGFESTLATNWLSGTWSAWGNHAASSTNGAEAHGRLARCGSRPPGRATPTSTPSPRAPWDWCTACPTP